MIDEMLTFLARAPTLGDLSLTWGQAGPRLGTGGVYLRGVKVLQTKTDLLGCQKLPCGISAAALPAAASRGHRHRPAKRPPYSGTGAWFASAAVNRLGNCEPLTEQVRTEGGQLDRADPGGTALYSIRVMAEYTMRYDA